MLCNESTIRICLAWVLVKSQLLILCSVDHQILVRKCHSLIFVLTEIPRSTAYGRNRIVSKPKGLMRNLQIFNFFFNGKAGLAIFLTLDHCSPSYINLGFVMLMLGVGPVHANEFFSGLLAIAFKLGLENTQNFR